MSAYDLYTLHNHFGTPSKLDKGTGTASATEPLFSQHGCVHDRAPALVRPWLAIAPPSPVSFSLLLSAFSAAAAGVGGRGPFYFAGASGPASFIPPLLAVVQFLAPRGAFGSAIRR